MSFKVAYSEHTKSKLAILVTKEGNKDILLGYRAFMYNMDTKKVSLYDFAVSSDMFVSQEDKEVQTFLLDISKKIERVRLIDNKQGGLISEFELENRVTVGELTSKEDIFKMVRDLMVVYVVTGKYELQTKKGV